MQRAKEAAPEPKAQRRAALRLIAQRGVVELQLLQRIPQVLERLPVRGVQPREDHELQWLVSRQRVDVRMLVQRHRVAHAAVAHFLEARRDVAHLSRAQLAHSGELGAKDPHLDGLRDRTRAQHADAVAALHHAVDDPHVGDHALVRVVVRVEDERPQRRPLLQLGRRHPLDDRRQQLVDAGPVLGRAEHQLLTVETKDLHHLVGHAFRLGGGQVDLVDNGDDVQIVAQRQVGVRQRLRLRPLRGVHHQQRPLAGRQRP